MTMPAPRAGHTDRPDLPVDVGSLLVRDSADGGSLRALTDRTPRSRTAVQEAAR